MMLKHLTAKEFQETMAYSSIEPFGEFRSELRHGQQMHLLDRVHFKRKKPLQPVDFMNFVKQPEEKVVKLKPEEMAKRIDKEIFGL